MECLTDDDKRNILYSLLDIWQQSDTVTFGDMIEFISSNEFKTAFEDGEL